MNIKISIKPISARGYYLNPTYINPILILGFIILDLDAYIFVDSLLAY